MVFLDEPTSGVDPISRRRFWALIDEMAGQGVTVFVTTHYLDEAEYCHRLALIHAGRLVALGTVASSRRSSPAAPCWRSNAPRVGEALELLGEQPWALETSVFGTRIHVVVRDAEEGRRQIGAALEQQGNPPRSIERIVPSLEDVFIHHVEEEEARRQTRSGPGMRRTWAVALKELRQVLRDPFSLLMLIGLPAFMLVLYGFALNFDVRHVALARPGPRPQRGQPRAWSPPSSTRPTSTWWPRPRRATTWRCSPSDAGQGGPGHPGGLRRRPRRRADGAVQLLLDGADATTATTVLGYARGLVAEANARLLSGAWPDRHRPRARDRLRAAGLVQPGARVDAVPGARADRLPADAHRRALDGALGGAREGARHHGAAAGRAAAHLGADPGQDPALPRHLGWPRSSSWSRRGCCSASRSAGSYLDLFWRPLLYLFGALGFGLLISTIADTQALAFQVGLIASMLPALLLSGFIFQIRTMPAVCRRSPTSCRPATTW